MPKYSIILPVRNGGEYVKECIANILSQTLSDFNLHILDNCSTDGTTDYINSIIDPRIILHPADKPLSIEENWLRITTIPKNEFITLIGHDDLLDFNYLEVMNALINKHPDATLYQTHFRYINAAGKTIQKCKPMVEKQSASEFLGFFLCNLIDTMGTGFMMRSKDYDDVKGIPMYPNLLFADFELWTSLAKKSYMATSFEECFAFRIHQSTTTTSSDMKFQAAFKRFVDFLLIQKSDPNLSAVIERYGITFISFYTKGLAHRLLRTPSSKRDGKTVQEVINECKVYADKLVPDNDFKPNKIFNIRIAKHIDSNPFSRSLFLAFKKFYSKPILS